MANANTEITLEAVYTAMTEAIRAQFSALQTVEFELLDRKNLPTPACLIEAGDMETTADAADPGTEQLAVTARFEARVILGFRQGSANPKIEAKKLAAALAVFIRLQRWGKPIGPAQVIGIYRDDFEPELDQFECYRVEWTHVLHLGDSIWNGEGVPLVPVYSWAPDIGIGHEQDYRELPELVGPGVGFIPE